MSLFFDEAEPQLAIYNRRDADDESRQLGAGQSRTVTASPMFPAARMR